MISHTHLHHSASESFWISGALIFAAFLYSHRWLNVRSRHHGNVEGWRAGSFVFGLSFIWIATASPLAALDHEMLTAHMVQHLLLMTLAPPLILLGMPRRPLTHGLSQGFLQAIGPPLPVRADTTIGKGCNSPGILLGGGGRHFSRVAYSFGFYARPAIAYVAWC